ncbi:SMP-30/gluconolactonase/LRE family protein [Fictibacillus enclensis]|uniref:SMP-30/gluconolactonase/LRE family protein n=1 Tax=Fictibacillus enclensis TaxID=1017270 RepID=UPI0025A0795D|nr:SMP-30/gluconolactonase/LRE family protein [Fictibacillus enclensis]MDM5201275.1 SMP-30/gluconolactonase/LRE family protein [Fictibacillus enclensis]
MTDKLELVHDAKAILGEGPIWDERSGKLYWVNILGKSIQSFDPRSGETKTFEIDQYPGTLALKEDGGFVLAAQQGFFHLELNEDGTSNLKKIADPEEHLPGNRFNDGKCDPRGRFLAGTLSLKEDKGAGSLYRLNLDGTVDVLMSDLTISNGMAWSDDGTVFYFIDTPTMQVKAYSYNLDIGEVGEGRVVKDFTDELGAPDGMTIDDEGMLWVALYGGWGVVQIDPADGKVLQKIDVPASNVTCCAFGGENLDELYITTARQQLSDNDLKEQPHAGGLFRYRPGVKGRPSFRFAGE